jgi:beta-N-acetylhexosaminidase
MLAAPVASVKASPLPQTLDHQQQAKSILANMTPEEKVGQLFLVSFSGQNVSSSSQIASLIRDYHVGGVVLSRANDNFTDASTILQDTLAMNTALQQTNWDASTSARLSLITGEQIKPQYVPLFIGISEEGDGYPYDQLLSGVTELPNLMSIGATWNPDNAKEVGAVMGKELEALGFNLLIGPSLDVLDVIYTDVTKNLGSRTFGGDPYWTGEFGQAYIQGLHDGSQDRLAVIAKYFPGSGEADRPPSEEVSTVRKSLEQLKQVELAPFIKVTSNTEMPDENVDGLLASHIRYQGFQGNIRETTRPVSFDQAALEQLLNLEPFTSWRNSGGVIVSDDLNSEAIRRFYDPTGQTFDGKQIARNAFLTGNDLLFVNQLKSVSDVDSYSTITKTLASFTQKYREDSAFAERVDLSVERILKLKLDIYENFLLNSVLTHQNSITEIGKSDSVTFEIVQQAATLISPDISELNLLLPDPPDRFDNIVFISETYQQRQCSLCEGTDVFSVDAFKNAVLRLYGPSASAQIFNHKLKSYSFTALTTYLDLINQEQIVPADIETDLKSADWIVFSVMNVDPAQPNAQALRRFLAEKPDLIRDKKIIVFSFTAPYYLDATELSKITAQYALYGKSNAAIEIAARLLFQEITPTGASPITIPGTGYDLIDVTSPNTDQIIPLNLLYKNQEYGADEIVTNESIGLMQGETIVLKTGTILDNNQNPVPDNTIVQFQFSNGTETINTQTVEAFTLDGVAQISYQIQLAGLTEIKAASDPARISQIIVLDIGGETGGEITTILPTPIPTPDLAPAATATEEVPVVEVIAEDNNLEKGFAQWLIAMIILWGSAVAFLMLFQRRTSYLWGIRLALTMVLGGLCGYFIWLMRSIQLAALQETSSLWSLFLALILGAGVGFYAGMLWRNYKKTREEKK